MTGAAVAAQATPRRGRWTGRSRTSPPSSRLLGPSPRSTPAPLAQASRSPRSPQASRSRRWPSTSRPTSPVLMAANTSQPSSACWTRAGLDEATRYNMTAIIGLPGKAVDQMAEAPWWPGLVAVAPTLVYDHQASHDIETDPDWRARWASVTVPTVVYSGDRTFPGLPEAADAVAAALSNAQRRVLAGQDHAQ